MANVLNPATLSFQQRAEKNREMQVQSWSYKIVGKDRQQLPGVINCPLPLLVPLHPI